MKYHFYTCVSHLVHRGWHAATPVGVSGVQLRSDWAGDWAMDELDLIILLPVLLSDDYFLKPQISVSLFPFIVAIVTFFWDSGPLEVDMLGYTDPV